VPVNYNLASDMGLSELDEASVASVMYHLTVGDEGITVKDTTLFQDLFSSKASTFGAAYDAIAASMSGSQRSLLGHVLGLQQIAPYDLAQTGSGSTSTSSIPTFTWKDADPAGTDDFIIQFYTVVSRIFCSNTSPVKSKTSVRLRSSRMQALNISTSKKTTK